MKKPKVDWVRALHELEEAKKLQKKKRGVPAWVWGLLPVLLLVPLMGTCGGSKEKPKKNIDGYTLGADGNYHSDRPAWLEGEIDARTGSVQPGDKVTVAENCIGYATAELSRQACRAAGKHAETLAQFNRDQVARGTLTLFDAGQRAVVVDVSYGSDTHCRIRREGDTRAWWVLRVLLSH